MEHSLELLDPPQRLTRLETQMQQLLGNGQPGVVHEVKKLAQLSVILSALALGTRMLDIVQAWLKH
jgi:hypothetical protein